MTEQIMSEGERSLAMVDLKDVVKAFNANFRDWEVYHGFGANFRFHYGEDGKKTLEIADIDPLNIAPPTVESLSVAKEVVGNALADTIKDEDNQGVRYPELTPISDRLQADLKSKTRVAVVNLIMGTVKESDLLLLSALGIDGRTKILDVFMEECQNLKKEFEHGTSSRAGNPRRVS